MDLLATLEGHENEVKSVAWSHTGRLLATCSRDKTVWIWTRTDDQQDFECVAVLSGHSQDVKNVAWHPHRDELVSCSYDDTVRTWVEEPSTPDEWSCAECLEGHGATVWMAAFEKSPPSTASSSGAEQGTENPRLATCGDDYNIRIWKYHKLPTDTGPSEESRRWEGDMA
eukprot:NODE_197_length_1837_cov_95.474832_g148_i0.p1 GENE.NODE_197_length_1837_cov_95.474832_g148_i0~~NODE_197_length_1837_cov_95.474832_g148_i0.p1  ORF type:complete len:170 (-),score=13.12 NODE_197_length_1837_cov_95.474832_g148_i0:884-1393(-)